MKVIGANGKCYSVKNKKPLINKKRILSSTKYHTHQLDKAAFVLTVCNFISCQ